MIMRLIANRIFYRSAALKINIKQATRFNQWRTRTGLDRKRKSTSPTLTAGTGGGGGLTLVVGIIVFCR